MAPIVFAESFAIAQKGGAREHVDLRAGVVDVIFARHAPSGEAEQVRQRVAKNGAARVADMHRSGRIGADIFDIDRTAAASRAGAVSAPSFQDGAQDVLENAPAAERY